MKKPLIYTVLALTSVLASCDEHEWKRTSVVEVPVLTIKSTLPDKTDSIDIYKDQKFVIKYRNSGSQLIKNDLVFIADSIDKFNYYCLNFTYTEPEGHSYEDKETGDIYIFDRLVNYYIAGDAGEKWEIDGIEEAEADITYSYVDSKGDTIEIDYDYIPEVKVYNKTSLY